MKYVMLVFLSVLVTITVVFLDMYYVIGKLYVREFGEEKLILLMKSATTLIAIHLSLYLVLVVLIALFISHKFAGPLFRLERVTELVAEGDLTVKAVFRQGDELFETADYMNHMIESLRQKVLKERNLSERISRRLDELSGKLTRGEMTPQQVSTHLGDVLVEVRHIASDFKL